MMIAFQVESEEEEKGENLVIEKVEPFPAQFNFTFHASSEAKLPLS